MLDGDLIKVVGPVPFGNKTVSLCDLGWLHSVGDSILAVYIRSPLPGTQLCPPGLPLASSVFLTNLVCLFSPSPMRKAG